MKRISFFIIAILLFAQTSLQSQEFEGASTALNYTGLENKLKKSEADIQDVKKNVKVKTWINRASLMVDIYNVNNDLLRKGMDPTSVKLFYKEPKEIQTTQEGPDKVEVYVYERVNLKFRNGVLDNWTDTKKIHNDPLTEANKAIVEAIKLNTDGKATEDIVAVINSLKGAYENEAINAFEAKDFKESHTSFIKFLDLNKLPIMNNKIDTIIYYYAGRAAFENGDYEEANKLFNEAAKYNYDDPFLYVFRKQSHFAVGDTATGVKIINEGFNKYPENQSILIELINYYLVSNQSDEALKTLALAKAGDPENVSFTFAEGTLYDKIGDFDMAVKSYKTCMEMKPDFYDAAFNLGVLYFNKAVKIFEEGSKVTDNTEYEKIKTEGEEYLKQAIPFMEKSHEISPDMREPLETLKTIYYRLQINDKYQDVVNKLNNM
jgi:tetratricopeptide (TPR) repeat protein